MNKSRTFPVPKLAERINEIINDSGMDISEFAESLNVSISTVYKWIYGSVNPSIRTIYKICRKYHVSADWLLGLK